MSEHAVTMRRLQRSSLRKAFINPDTGHLIFEDDPFSERGDWYFSGDLATGKEVARTICGVLWFAEVQTFRVASPGDTKRWLVTASDTSEWDEDRNEDYFGGHPTDVTIAWRFCLGAIFAPPFDTSEDTGHSREIALLTLEAESAEPIRRHRLLAVRDLLGVHDDTGINICTFGDVEHFVNDVLADLNCGPVRDNGV